MPFSWWKFWQRTNSQKLPDPKVLQRERLRRFLGASIESNTSSPSSLIKPSRANTRKHNRLRAFLGVQHETGPDNTFLKTIRALFSRVASPIGSGVGFLGSAVATRYWRAPTKQRKRLHILALGALLIWLVMSSVITMSSMQKLNGAFMPAFLLREWGVCVCS